MAKNLFIYVSYLQISKHVFAGFVLMLTLISMSVQLVIRTFPRATNAFVRAFGRSLETLVTLMHIETMTSVHDVAVGARGRQFGQRFLHSQIAAARCLAYFTTAIRTRGLLVFETCVSEQMRKTTSAHQVSIGALVDGSLRQILKTPLARSRPIGLRFRRLLMPPRVEAPHG